jgi:hypothetical protein
MIGADVRWQIAKLGHTVDRNEVDEIQGPLKLGIKVAAASIYVWFRRESGICQRFKLHLLAGSA